MTLPITGVLPIALLILSLPSEVLAAQPVTDSAPRTAQEATLRPQVKVVDGGESKAKPEDCRGTLVGPSVNPPDPFPGWGGFVGWESPIRLKNGTWLVGFNAGYWHASAPTPLHYPAKTIDHPANENLNAGAFN